MQSGARWAASASSKSRPPHRSSLPARVTATPPERPRRVMAKPEEVITGFQLLFMTEVIIGDAPVAMGSMTGRVVGL